MKSKNICCEGQKVGQQLKGTFLFGSLGYRRFIFKISAPGLPGRYLYTTLYIYANLLFLVVEIQHEPQIRRSEGHRAAGYGAGGA